MSAELTSLTANIDFFQIKIINAPNFIEILSHTTSLARMEQVDLSKNRRRKIINMNSLSNIQVCKKLNVKLND